MGHNLERKVTGHLSVSQLTGRPLFYLAAPPPLLVSDGLLVPVGPSERLYEICFGIEPFVPIPSLSASVFPMGCTYSKAFCVTPVGRAGSCSTPQGQLSGLQGAAVKLLL